MAAHYSRHGSTKRNVDDALHGYLVCALWSSNDESDESGGEPLDKNYDLGDIAPESKRKARATIVKFMRENRAAIADYVVYRERGRYSDYSIYESLGHDLWLTRNGHGTGFWDRDYGGHDEVGEKLTKASEKLGEQYAMVGDDGQIYLEGGR